MQFQIGRFFRTHRGETSAGSSSGSGQGTRPGSRSSAPSDAGRLSALRSRNTGSGSPGAMPPRQAAPGGADAHRQEDVKAAIAHMRRDPAPPSRPAASADAHRQEDIQAAIAHMHGRDEPQHVDSPQPQAIRQELEEHTAHFDASPSSPPRDSYELVDDFDIDALTDADHEAAIAALLGNDRPSAPTDGEASAAITSKRSDTFALGREAPALRGERYLLPTITEEPAGGSAPPMHPILRDAFHTDTAEYQEARRKQQRDMLAAVPQESNASINQYKKHKLPPLHESATAAALAQELAAANTPRQGSPAREASEASEASEAPHAANAAPAQHHRYPMRTWLSERDPTETARAYGLESPRASVAGSNWEPGPVPDLASVREHPANGEPDASMLKYDRQGLPPLRDAPLSAALPRQLGAEASTQPGGAEATLPAPSGQSAPAASSSHDNFQEARDFLSSPSATLKGSAQQETTPPGSPARGANETAPLQSQQSMLHRWLSEQNDEEAAAAAAAAAVATAAANDLARQRRTAEPESSLQAPGNPHAERPRGKSYMSRFVDTVTRRNR
ncbi:hypothetical protein M5C99_09295 [Acidovorax sp. NCPPB 2350]|nr:hypothetical protein M5C99_09295 [Acidovorax sp. NCPPB 2350]